VLLHHPFICIGSVARLGGRSYRGRNITLSFDQTALLSFRQQEKRRTM